jgi:membrane protein required for colicin V production
MHPADIFILAVIAFSIWKGFRRGLVREAIALLGWVAGIVVALNSYESLAPLLAAQIQTPSLRLAAAFLLICLGIVAVMFMVGQVLRSLLSALALGPADHLMGGVFGFARGVLITVLAVGVLGRFFHNDPWWKAAELPRALMPFAPVALSLTDEVKARVRQLPRIPIQSANPDH